MTENEMKKLSRADLLELLLQERKENESLRAEIESLKARLDDHILRIEKAGSIAEASLQINGVFEAAEKAAHQYLENIYERGERYKKSCEKIMLDMEARCLEMENRMRANSARGSVYSKKPHNIPSSPDGNRGRDSDAT